MTNSKSQKVGGSQAAGPAKCGAQSSKNKKAAPVCVFENPEFGMVRMATDEKGEPWFCAKDLCDVLGYKKASDSVKQHVKSSDTMKRGVTSPVKNRFGVCEGKLKNVQMIFVNESGFYALVLLPQIRKTGGYIPVNEGESEEEMIRNAEQILRATLKEKEALLEKQKKLLEEQKILLHQQEVQMGLDKKLIGEQDEEIHRLNEEVNDQMVRMAIQGQNVVALERQVDGLLPKAMYSDNVLDSVSCFTTTQVFPACAVLPEWAVYALCGLCAHGAGEEPHPISCLYGACRRRNEA